MASAQVKSAILLAGLFAKGKTTLDEPSASRNHTELMFNYFLIRTAKSEDAISVFGDQIPESRDFSIPGDISSAAFWLVAAAAQSGGHLLVRNIGLNDTRTALLGVLVRMGAQVREAVEGVDQLEPRGVVEVTGDFDNTARFQLIDAFNRFTHLRAHSHQNAEQCRPSVIQSDVANEQMAAGLGSGRDQPKGGRRNVAWN